MSVWYLTADISETCCRWANFVLQMWTSYRCLPDVVCYHGVVIIPSWLLSILQTRCGGKTVLDTWICPSKCLFGHKCATFPVITSRADELMCQDWCRFTVPHLSSVTVLLHVRVLYILGSVDTGIWSCQMYGKQTCRESNRLSVSVMDIYPI